LYDVECVAYDERNEHSSYGCEVDFELRSDGNRRIYDGFEHCWVVDGVCKRKCDWEKRRSTT
jgi:hypothetical protein